MSLLASFNLQLLYEAGQLFTALLALEPLEVVRLVPVIELKLELTLEFTQGDQLLGGEDSKEALDGCHVRSEEATLART